MSSELESPGAAVAPADAEPRSTFFRWLKRLRERKLAAKGLDLGGVRLLVSLLVIGMTAAFVPSPTAAIAAQIVAAAAGVLMCAYFTHMLLFRLQLSLLEWCVLIALLGNIQGLLLTMPGIRSVGLFWLSLLIPMIAAWVLYGAVKGLIQAEVLEVVSPFKRALFIVSGVLTIAAPALFLCGGILWSQRGETKLVSPNMAAWSVPLMLLGAAGLALRVSLGLVTRRAARNLFVAATSVSNHPPPQ